MVDFDSKTAKYGAALLGGLFLLSRGQEDGQQPPDDGNGDQPPSNESPTASFTTTTTVEKIAVDASGSSDPDGSIESYSWTVTNSNGTAVAVGNSVQNQWFLSPGTYTVELTVTDNDGATATATKQATIPVDGQPGENHPPDAVLTVEATGVGLEVVADAFDSTDPDGDTLSFEFDMGNGDTVTDPNGNLVYTYDEPGTYTVTVYVTDEHGASDNASDTVTVGSQNQAPTASFNLSTSNVTTDSATLSMSSTASDPNGDPLTYSWVITWPSGGETSASGTSHSVTVDQEGTYQVQHTVTDEHGASDTVSKGTTVQFNDPSPPPDTNDPPNAQFSAAVVNDPTGTDYVVCDGSDSSDPDGSVVSWEWEAVQSLAGLTRTLGTGSGKSFTFDLPDGEQATVTLAVTDDDGATDTASKTVSNFSDSNFNSYIRISSHDLAPSGANGEIASDATLEVVSGGQWATQESDNRVTFGIPLGDGPVTIGYDGEITTLDWDDPIYVEQEIGGEYTKVDPFGLDPTGGPRRRWTGGSRGGVVEITLYQTRQLHDRNGWGPAETVANQLEGIFQHYGQSYDILYKLPLVGYAIQDSTCGSPLKNGKHCRDSGCESIDCCSDGGLLPPTLYPFNGELKAENNDIKNPVAADYRQLTGEPLPWDADCVTIRADSNTLLTDNDGGGCGFAGGWACTAGVSGIDSAYQWPGYMEFVDGDTPPGGHIHVALHEIAHNFGYTHRDDCSADNAGGIAWYQWVGVGEKYWKRTPAPPKQGETPCKENDCGQAIGDRDRDTESGIRAIPTYTECSMNAVFDFTSYQGPLIEQSVTGLQTTGYQCDCSGEIRTPPTESDSRSRRDVLGSVGGNVRTY